MNHSRQRYQRALDEFQRVITSFPDECWDRQTPCTGWTARMLAGHVVDGHHQIAGILTGQPRPPELEAAELARIAGQDPARTWRHARREIDEALEAVPDATVLATPAGDQTVEALLDTAIVEPLLHSWDLAVTADLDIELDRDAIEAVLGALAHIGGALASTGMFAPALAVHDGMSGQDRLLALTGRNPEAARRRS